MIYRIIANVLIVTTLTVSVDVYASIKSYGAGSLNGFTLTWHIDEVYPKPGKSTLRVKACKMDIIQDNMTCSESWTGLADLKGNGTRHDDILGVSVHLNQLRMFADRRVAGCRVSTFGPRGEPVVGCTTWHVIR